MVVLLEYKFAHSCTTLTATIIFPLHQEMSIDYTTVSYAGSLGAPADPLRILALYKHSSAPDYPRFWLIFIHGGAWRDPTVDHSDTTQILSTLIAQHPTTLAAASIDYTLSKPLDGSQGRGARHPDFALDAFAAIRYLYTHHGVDKFIVAGHSAGAFMALQLLIDPGVLLDESAEQLSVYRSLFGEDRTDEQALIETSKFINEKCQAVIGIAGIYSLPLLPIENAGYLTFTEEAFGTDQSTWQLPSVVPYASPANFAMPASDSFKFVIVYSKADQLLNPMIQPQVAPQLYMLLFGKDRVFLEETTGLHDESYQTPRTVEIFNKYLKEYID